MTEIYRIYDAMPDTNSHFLSVISDGESTSFVNQDTVEKSSDPKDMINRALKYSKKPPKTSEEWAVLAYSLFPLSRITMREFDGSVEEATEAEEALFDVYLDRAISAASDRDLSDKINELMTEKPELSEFFESEDESLEEPDAMRDYIRLILEHENALDLNPSLKDWLDGGEAPKDFEGLIFYKENSEVKDR